MIELQNKLIATGSYDNTIKIWDISKDSNNAFEKEYKEEGKVFSLLEFEPNVILSAIDKTPDNVQEISQISPDYIAINCWDLNASEISQISPDYIAINCWDLNASLEKTLFSLKGHQLRVNCLAKCNDKFFASCSNDCTIIIWNYTLREKANTLKGHQDCVLCMIQLNNGKLCSGSADFTIKINLGLGKRNM